MNIEIQTPHDVTEILHKHDVSLTSINGIILSHWHFDHLGDPSIFPSSTSLIVGPGFTSAFAPGYPTVQTSPIPELALAGRHLQEVDFSHCLEIGGLKAIDFLSDGSLYLLSTPGHAVGHMSVLARVHVDLTGQSSFLLLAGDLCHHPGELRPSSRVPFLQPGDTSRTICPDLIQRVHPTQSKVLPFYQPADGPFNADSSQMKQTIDVATAFDADPNILVLVSHDNSLLSDIPLFPANLDDWKQKGWKERLRWKFLSDFRL